MSSKVFLSLRLPVGQAQAFAAFTEDIAAWWQPDPLFPITAQGDGSLAFEGGAGGRLITRLESGAVFEIGRISVWEPGKRLVFSWRQASFAPDQSTEVEVRFEAAGEETRISIEHRAWDTIPQGHLARHGFPEAVTLQRVADWWRSSLARLRRQPSAGAGEPRR